MQTELIYTANGMEPTALQAELELLRGALDIIRGSGEASALQTPLKEYYLKKFGENPGLVPEGIQEEAMAQTYTDRLGTPWMHYFLKYDPAPALEALSCPVLALVGAKDLQVPAESNLKAIREALEKGGNENSTVKSLENLNHLFQEANSGSPSEYAQIEQTFSLYALKIISDWVQKTVN